MSEESEAKFKVDSHEPIRRRLGELGAEPLGAYLETDRYLDADDGRLAAGDRALRIRTREPIDPSARPSAGARAELTYKGPADAGRRIKVRRELQTVIADPSATADLFAELGYRVRMIKQKRRTSYRLDACRVELDELPRLGCFVEVEGPDEPAITAVCDRLGLTGRPILVPYTALIRDYCARHNLDPSEFTFEKVG